MEGERNRSGKPVCAYSVRLWKETVLKADTQELLFNGQDYRSSDFGSSVNLKLKHLRT